MGWIERNGGTALRAGASHHERGVAGELADLAGELPRPFNADRGFMTEAVTPRGLDRSGKHQPDRGGQLADLDHDGARLEAARRTAGEAARDLDLCRREHREHLVVPGLENTQRLPPSVPPGRAPSIPKPYHLTLRRARSARLEGRATPRLHPTLRD